MLSSGFCSRPCSAARPMLSGLDGQGKADAWEEISTDLQQFDQDGVFDGPCELVVGIGTR